MKAWITYLNERSPIVALLPLALGITLSTLSISGSINTPSMNLGTLLLITIFILMRLMDEVKDYEKDKIAHPERPLPRGLLTVDQVRKGILILVFALFAAALIIAFDRGSTPGILIAFTTFYAWLMYKEFYIGKALANYPLLYAISHQVIIFPLYAIPLSLFDSEAVSGERFLEYAAMNLGASMAFEFCRKYDTAAHPVLKTYLSVYGRTKTNTIVYVSLAVASFFALKQSLGVLVPLNIVVASSVFSLSLMPARHKMVEGLCTLATLGHIFGYFIQWRMHS